jgi:rubrerythrin
MIAVACAISIVSGRKESMMKILDFAIDVEQAERDLYRRLAACSQHEGIRSIFKMIASDEGKLLKKLKQLKQDPENNALELQVSPTIPKSVRKTQAGSCELLDQHNVRDDLSGYNYILKTEQLLLNLYLNLKEHEKDPEAKALFDLILQEKQLEIDRIHMIFDFINAPNQYLAWGEFSNIGEFHNFGRDED